MKKYLLGVLAISILVGGYSFATSLTMPSNTLDGVNSDSNGTLTNPTDINRQSSSPVPVNPNASTPGANICNQFKSSDSLYASCAGCVQKKGQGEGCSQAFSCETLFTDSNTANICNLERCKVQRGKDSSYCQCKYVKKGIPLNTSIPFLGNCLEKANSDDPTNTAALNAFPTIISVASRILVTVIMLVGFIMIVVGGVQWSAGNAKDGKAMIKKVAIGFALLGAMGAILRLINPNFFK